MKDNGSVVRFYVGDKTEDIRSGIKDISYMGSNVLACITDRGNISVLDNDKFQEFNIKADGFI